MTLTSERKSVTEHQKRADFVKRSIEMFHSFASREPYRSRIELLYGMGFRASVLDTVLNPDTYEHVAFRDNTPMPLPFDSSSHAIGVVAIRAGETAVLSVDTHPLQPVEIEAKTLTASFPQHAGAVTFNPTKTDTVASNKLRTYLRPTLFLPYSDDRTHEFPSVIAHEALHEAQQLNEQVRVYDNSSSGELDRMVDDYNHEFDAYDFQRDMFMDEVEETLLDASMSMANEVALFRKQHLGSAGGRVTRDTLEDTRTNRIIGPIVGHAYKRS